MAASKKNTANATSATYPNCSMNSSGWQNYSNKLAESSNRRHEHMKVTLNDQVVAEADKNDLIYIEGNWYFPPSSANTELFAESPTPYTCPWKGVCQYWNVSVGDRGEV